MKSFFFACTLLLLAVIGHAIDDHVNEKINSNILRQTLKLQKKIDRAVGEAKIKLTSPNDIIASGPQQHRGSLLSNHNSTLQSRRRTFHTLHTGVQAGYNRARIPMIFNTSIRFQPDNIDSIDPDAMRFMGREIKRWTNGAFDFFDVVGYMNATGLVFSNEGPSGTYVCNANFPEAMTSPDGCAVVFNNFWLTVSDATCCMGGGGGIGIKGAGHSYELGVKTHETMHAIGVGHENERWMAGVKNRPFGAADGPSGPFAAPLWSQRYGPTDGSIETEQDSAVGPWDKYSWMHSRVKYPFTADATTPEGCGLALSPWDVVGSKYMTSGGFPEGTRLPRCRTNIPVQGLKIGSQERYTVTFFVSYIWNHNLTLVPDWMAPVRASGCPPNVICIPPSSYYPLASFNVSGTDPGKYNVSIDFGNMNGGSPPLGTNHTANVSCWAEFEVLDAPFVCDGIPSTDPKVCSGHGVCNQTWFPQCGCAAGYSGQWCNGIEMCPQDIFFDFDDWDTGIDCNLLPGITGRRYYSESNPDGPAWNATWNYGFTHLLAPADQAAFDALTKPFNGSNLAVTLDPGHVHQYSSVSILVKVTSNVNDSVIVAAGAAFHNIPFSLLQNWTLVRIVNDFSSFRQTLLVDGVVFSVSKCETVSYLGVDYKVGCVNNTESIYVGSAVGQDVLVDRIHGYCEVCHVDFVFPDFRLPQTATVLDGGKYTFQLKAGHRDYVWNTSRISSGEKPLCNVTHYMAPGKPSAVITYTGSYNVLNVTVRNITAFPYAIFCKPLSEHFEPSTTTRNISLDPVLYFRVSPVCVALVAVSPLAWPLLPNWYSYNDLSVRPETIELTFSYTTLDVYRSLMWYVTNQVNVVVQFYSTGLGALTVVNRTNTGTSATYFGTGFSGTFTIVQNTLYQVRLKFNFSAQTVAASLLHGGVEVVVASPVANNQTIVDPVADTKLVVLTNLTNTSFTISSYCGENTTTSAAEALVQTSRPERLWYPTPSSRRARNQARWDIDKQVWIFPDEGTSDYANSVWADYPEFVGTVSNPPVNQNSVNPYTNLTATTGATPGTGAGWASLFSSAHALGTIKTLRMCMLFWFVVM